MITKKTEYAIRALWELHLKPGTMMTANQVAQKQKIPPKYLPQIVSQLNQAGLITSLRGYGGGIKLSKPADKISVLDVIVAIQGNPILFECQHSPASCSCENSCGLMGVYNNALNSMLDIFKRAFLSELNMGVNS